MNKNSWSTAQDVLNDLPLTSGRKGCDFDGFIVVGEKPPPVRRQDIEDDEMNLRYGLTKDTLINSNGTVKPDLIGIQEMLRMVYEYNNEVDDTCCRTNDVITISKLNPNVEEFVPKLNPDVEEFVPKSAIASSLNSVRDETKNVTYDELNEPKDSDIDKNYSSNEIELAYVHRNKSTNSSIKSDCKGEVAAILKEKISNASHNDNFHVKREKNVAIATLLKLYSKPSETQAMADTPVLCTPDYFKNCKAKNKTENAEENAFSEKRVIQCDEPSTLASVTTDCPNIDNNKLNDISRAKGLYPSDEEMKVSIDKVKNWLHNELPTSPKPKVPTLYLGPVVYKRKESSKTSHLSTVAFKHKDLDRKSPVQSVKEIPSYETYKPSQYADELEKQYSERLKRKEELNDTLWTRVERQLKERDANIKNKSESKSLVGSSDRNSSNGDQSENRLFVNSN